MFKERGMDLIVTVFTTEIRKCIRDASIWSSGFTHKRNGIHVSGPYMEGHFLAWLLVLWLVRQAERVNWNVWWKQLCVWLADKMAADMLWPLSPSNPTPRRNLPSCISRQPLPHVAVNHLMSWIRRCKPIHDALVDQGYRKTTIWLSPCEVRLITEYLGEP